MSKSNDIHVMPIGDLREHLFEDCWCRPLQDEDEPSVIIHNAMDEREAYERGRKLQ